MIKDNFFILYLFNFYLIRTYNILQLIYVYMGSFYIEIIDPDSMQRIDINMQSCKLNGIKYTNNILECITLMM